MRSKALSNTSCSSSLWQYSGIWKSGKRRRRRDGGRRSRDGGRRSRGGGECVDKRGIEGDGNEEKDVRKEEYYKQTQYVRHLVKRE